MTALACYTPLATVLPVKSKRRIPGQAAIDTLHDLGSHDAYSHGDQLVGWQRLLPEGCQRPAPAPW